MTRIFRPSLFALFFIILSIPAVSGQVSRPNFNRERNIDVQHYLIRTSFDRKNKIVFGDTTVRLKPLNDNFRTLELDAVGMNFEFVRLDPAGTDLKYRTTADKIIITLDRAYSANDVISVRFSYSTKPKKGVYFVDAYAKNGQVVRAAQVWTQGESQESRHWFPSFDFPDDKATTEQYITVEKGETAIANGELLETIEDPDGRKTFHFLMPVVHSTYLTSFIVGTYTRIDDRYKDIPLGFYVYPDKTAIVQPAFGRTKDMIRVFEELTRVKYPYNKYDQTIVAQFNLGGMENITATTMADFEILSANSEFARDAVTDLVSHELSHSWFGNLVTCRNWAELWLNEGFATFMEAAYREKVFGQGDYLRKIAEDADQFIISDAVTRNRHALFNLRADPNNDDSMFDTTTYQKGGAVIHTLRETVGNEAFWNGINAYLEQHKFGNAETADLQKALEEAAGMDLDWFFAQWVYGGGYPKLDVRRIYHSRKKVLEVTVSQIQKADSLTPAVFILPLNIQIRTRDGIRTEPVRITRRTETFSFKLTQRPLDVSLDKELKIPIKTVKYQPLVNSPR